MYSIDYRRRLGAVFFCFGIFFLCCSTRLIFIQIFRSQYLVEIARKQHNLYTELEPRRGTIYDVNLRPQAINVTVDSLYASPESIPDAEKEKLVEKLLPILNVDEAYLRDRLQRRKAFIWLARKLSPQQSEEIRGINIRGIDFIKESKRCYPNGYLASQVIGFAGLDNKGLEGVEYLYDGYLKGTSGWALFLRDARQKRLDLKEQMVPPKDGYDLILTIDEVIQFIAERELEGVVKKYKAKGASLIVIQPHTGEVLAMVNRPTFDLNEFMRIDKDVIRNRAICDLFEPGSVFKIVTASAALQEVAVDQEEKFFCENGEYRVASHTLHDHRPHGWLTFREVVEQSSNIGMSKIAQRIGAENVVKYIRLFGFGTKSGIDLPGEIGGIIRDVQAWSKVSIATIPMGHEVGVTALQLAVAISTIANGGYVMRPYVVKEIRDRHGETIKQFFPQQKMVAFSFETAQQMKSILRGVIENGTGKMARLGAFSAAGKTGTAQKIEPDGKYSHRKFIASFIGFAPVENPLIAIAVVVDEPQPYYFGGVVAAPVFKRVAEEVLRYLHTKNITKKEVTLDEIQ